MPDEPSSRRAGASALSQLPAELAQSELLRAAQRLGARLEAQSDDLEDDVAALRWRRALLRLSEAFLDAAEERRDLSPILLGALHNALEQLLIHGEEADLMALEEWLAHDSLPEDVEMLPASGAADTLIGGAVQRGPDRRLLVERRAGADRRGIDTGGSAAPLP